MGTNPGHSILLIAITVLLAGGARVVETGAGEILFVPLSYGIAHDQKVGVKKAGLICLPNGSVTFGDLRLQAAVDGEAARKLTVFAMDASRWPSASPDRLLARPKIQGRVVDIEVDVCAKRWGFGNRTGVRGQSRVVVEWSIRGNGQSALSLTSRGRYSTGADVEDVSDIVAKAIRASAENLVNASSNNDL